MWDGRSVNIFWILAQSQHKHISMRVESHQIDAHGPPVIFRNEDRSRGFVAVGPDILFDEIASERAVVSNNKSLQKIIALNVSACVNDHPISIPDASINLSVYVGRISWCRAQEALCTRFFFLYLGFVLRCSPQPFLSSREGFQPSPPIPRRFSFVFVKNSVCTLTE